MKKNCGLLSVVVLSSLLFFLSTSCEQDSYEKGEGRYSLMRGDFAELHINTDKKADAVTTDDGDQFPLVGLFSAKWINVADTTYRCMLYYNKVKTADGKLQAEVISVGQVPCPYIKPLSDFEKEVRTDPVRFESMWMSKSGKYLNMSFQLKTGQTEDSTAVHQLAFLSDKQIIHPDEKRTLHFFLYHDQGKMPEYYSTQVYVSIPIKGLEVDSVCFTVNTYSGPIVKTLPIR